jgi:hypothetical protein
VAGGWGWRFTAAAVRKGTRVGGPTGELGHGPRRGSHVPDADAAVRPARSEKAAIGGVGESLDAVGVAGDSSGQW